ncbi:unnamed protein product [Cylicocyclus nassatus]|uniref:Uncharacterized protein n=1 Tax=Cylicocyclus nassatus TaxID=53992 RepID=A0AA36HCC5_CYLNA|nr:unnamed protein product [Cylicocyclus nassatus]
MMRHFVAFSLLLFVLKITVEATKVVPNYALCSVFIGDSGCRAGCSKQLNCQNGHCKKVTKGLFTIRCVCEDCPGGQQTRELPGAFLSFLRKIPV